MDSSESTPKQTPASEQAPQDSDIILPGHGAALQRMPEWFRKKRPGEAFTQAEKEQLREWFRPMTEKLWRDYEQRFDRQAVLEALPDWMYDKLLNREPTAEGDGLRLREYFALNHPDLAERIDPVDVIRGWNYGRWQAANHGDPAPELPPRPGHIARGRGKPDRGTGTDNVGS